MVCSYRISIILVIAFTLISCSDTGTGTKGGDGSSGSTTGAIEVTTSTSGNSQDSDGYTVSLGQKEKDISNEGTVTFNNLDEGSHSVELTGLAKNCNVDGDNPRSANVTAGQTTSISFQVQCEEIQTLSEQTAVDAAKQVIQDKGWTVPSKAQATPTSNSEPSILDYIATDVTESGAREVYMNIGPDGHLIPTSEWQSNNQGHCKQASLRYMKAADKRFNLQLFSFSDGYDVFAQYIDIETGKIEEQREGQSSSLVDAITTAWDKMESPVNKPTDACGEKISNLTLTLSATTHLETIPKDAPNYSTTTDEQVEATVDLTYDTQDSMYVGSGNLTWANFDYSEADCELPDTASVKVHKFVYGDPTTPQGETELQIQFHDIPKDVTCTTPNDSYDIWADFSFSWWLLHENEIHKKVNLDGLTATIEYIYSLKNWEAFPVSPVLIVQKQYDHSRRIEDDDFINNVKGESTIRILHESN